MQRRVEVALLKGRPRKSIGKSMLERPIWFWEDEESTLLVPMMVKKKKKSLWSWATTSSISALMSFEEAF